MKVKEEIDNLDIKKQIEIIKKSKYFNKEYYINKYKDIQNTDPYEHYAIHGWKEKRFPSPEFDPNKYYIINNITKNLNPIIHYELFGKENDYKIQACDYKIVKDSILFDSRFYTAKYEDISRNAESIDPVEHYINNGWKEGRIPSLRLDPNKYKQDNKIEEDINPVIHYETIGRYKGLKVSKVSVNTQNDLLASVSTIEKKSHEESVIRNIKKTKETIKKINEGNFKRVKILYISNTSQKERSINDGSTRYRCFHPAETLQMEKAIAIVCTLDEFLRNPSYGYDIYIFHRPNNKAIPVIRELKKLFKILIADYDDLIFGPFTNAIESSIVKNGRKTCEEAADIFYKNTVALNYFNNFSASTEELASNILYHKPVANIKVINNFIPDSILKISSICKCKKSQRDYSVIIYCSGSNSHNEDFKVVAETFKKFLNKNPNQKLYIFGDLNPPKELYNCTNVYYHSKVDYWSLFNHMKNYGYSISPLVINKFNLCKSNVKFLESCVAGNLLLASPIPDFKRVKDAKIHLVDQSDWDNVLNNLKTSTDNNYIEQNYNYLINNCSSRKFIEQFRSLFNGVIV